MDIAEIVSTEYAEFDRETPVSEAIGAFADPSVKALVIKSDGEFDGVVTRRQLSASSHPPSEKLGSIIWHVPRVEPTEDVREVAQLMIDGDSHVLPVFDGDRMRGVVTADDLLAEVQPFLDAATVADAATRELVTVTPGTTFGEALHVLREHRITHLPVVEDDTAVGILSLYDLTGVTARSMRQSQGGTPGGFDAHGGEGSGGGYRSHGGFGAREGETDRMLDIPVRDLMVAEVRTITPEETLDVAFDEMAEIGGSSLVVVSAEGRPSGIVTKTDLLAALTWEEEGNRAVQLTGADLLDDITYDEIVAMVDGFDDKDADMAVLDAKIHLHEHDESRRGTPLLLARFRLATDRGLFIASGEGYGSRHAISQARDALERRIRDDRSYGFSKKHPGAEYWERRFGWLLE